MRVTHQFSSSPRERTWALAHLALLLPLLTPTACKQASTVSSGDTLARCDTWWSGPLAYDGARLAVRGCLNDELCSDELNFELDWTVDQPSPGGICELPGASCDKPNARGATADYGEFNFVTGIVREEHSLGELTSTFYAVHGYGITQPSGLSASDRPSLAVRGEEGEFLLEATSVATYADAAAADPNRPGPTAACKSIWLNLDGSMAPSPWADSP